MQCPYCDTELEDSEELDFHALKFHPEKTSMADRWENKTTRIWDTAIQLTACSLGVKGGAAKEKVMETYRYFLRELMKSERE
jgi:hypothetical protein